MKTNKVVFLKVRKPRQSYYNFLLKLSIYTDNAVGAGVSTVGRRKERSGEYQTSPREGTGGVVVAHEFEQHGLSSNCEPNFVRSPSIIANGSYSQNGTARYEHGENCTTCGNASQTGGGLGATSAHEYQTLQGQNSTRCMSVA